MCLCLCVVVCVFLLCMCVCVVCVCMSVLDALSSVCMRSHCYKALNPSLSSLSHIHSLKTPSHTHIHTHTRTHTHTHTYIHTHTHTHTHINRPVLASAEGYHRAVMSMVIVKYVGTRTQTDGLFHGKGTATFKDGCVYCGQFKVTDKSCFFYA